VDVAARVGVSLATASLALTGKGRISAEVREQVLAAAQAVGYRRRGLPAGPERVRKVGILHHLDKNFEWNFIRPILFNLEAMLLEHDLLPILLPVSVGVEAEKVFQRVLSAGAGAVLSIHFHDESLFERLEKRGIRVVIVNNTNLQDRFHSVCVDDFQGAYEGCLHLLNLGHRHILYAEYERPDLPAVVADRFIGFRKALEEHAVPFPAGGRITIRSMNRRELASRLEAAFAPTSPPASARRPRPTAIFAHDDYLASYIYACLRELGLKVPEEVSLIAPGDVLDYGEPCTPPITTMRINTASLGILAGRLLLDLLRGEIHDVHVLKLKQQLVRRGTCARPA
jgi:LacI family transcriptional regulator